MAFKPGLLVPAMSSTLPASVTVKSVKKVVTHSKKTFLVVITVIMTVTDLLSNSSSYVLCLPAKTAGGILFSGCSCAVMYLTFVNICYTSVVRISPNLQPMQLETRTYYYLRSKVKVTARPIWSKITCAKIHLSAEGLWLKTT